MKHRKKFGHFARMTSLGIGVLTLALFLTTSLPTKAQFPVSVTRQGGQCYQGSYALSYGTATCTSNQEFNYYQMADGSTITMAEQGLCVSSSRSTTCSLYCMPNQYVEIRCPAGYEAYYRSADGDGMFKGYYCAKTGTAATLGATYTWGTLAQCSDTPTQSSTPSSSTPSSSTPSSSTTTTPSSTTTKTSTTRTVDVSVSLEPLKCYLPSGTLFERNAFTCTATKETDIKGKTYLNKILSIDSNRKVTCISSASVSAAEARCPTGYTVYKGSLSDGLLMTGYYCQKLESGTSGQETLTIGNYKQECTEKPPEAKEEVKKEDEKKREEVKQEVKEELLKEKEQRRDEKRERKAPKEKESLEEALAKAKRFFDDEIAGDPAFQGLFQALFAIFEDPSKIKDSLNCLDSLNERFKTKFSEGKNKILEAVLEASLPDVTDFPTFVEACVKQNWTEEFAEAVVDEIKTFQETPSENLSTLTDFCLSKLEENHEKAYKTGASKFKDIGLDSWYCPYMQKQTFFKGLKNEAGKSTGDVAPARAAMNIEVLLGLLRAFDYPGVDDECELEAELEDVPAWGNCAVNIAAEFMTLDKPMTDNALRETVALWIAELTKVEKSRLERFDTKTVDAFKDCEKAAKDKDIKEALGFVIGKEIMTGRGVNWGCGKAIIRAEVAATILRALEKIK